MGRDAHGWADAEGGASGAPATSSEPEGGPGVRANRTKAARHVPHVGRPDLKRARWREIRSRWSYETIRFAATRKPKPRSGSRSPRYAGMRGYIADSGASGEKCRKDGAGGLRAARGAGSAPRIRRVRAGEVKEIPIVGWSFAHGKAGSESIPTSPQIADNSRRLPAAGDSQECGALPLSHAW
jgi:hypothetical protein